MSFCQRRKILTRSQPLQQAFSLCLGGHQYFPDTHTIRHEVHPLIGCKVISHFRLGDGDGVADGTPVFTKGEIVLPFSHLFNDGFVFVQSSPLRFFGQEFIAYHDADVMAQMVGGVDSRPVGRRQRAQLG